MNESKIPNVAPALVAMVQIPVIGKFQRKFSLKECLRLQDFPDNFTFGDQSDHESYKQLGNSICVKVLEKVISKLLEIGEEKEKKRLSGNEYLGDSEEGEEEI